MKSSVMTQIYVLVLAVLSTAAQAQEPWANERKIQGENNLEWISAAAGTDAYQRAQAVASMEHLDGESFCTASRVGDRLFLTNFHCDYPCDTIQFRMGFEAGVDVLDQQLFRCTQLVHKSELLDYALYEVEPYLPDGARDRVAGYPILHLSKAALTNGERVYVASHPEGRPMEIDRSAECVLSDVVPFMTASGRNTIKHMCDTEGGSSGAPVLDQTTGFAVALHWGGRDGEYNMAIPMSLILADLEAVAPDAYARLCVEN